MRRICYRWFYCHTHRFSKMDKRRFALPKCITIKAYDLECIILELGDLEPLILFSLVSFFPKDS